MQEEFVPELVNTHVEDSEPPEVAVNRQRLSLGGLWQRAVHGRQAGRMIIITAPLPGSEVSRRFADLGAALTSG